MKRNYVILSVLLSLSSLHAVWQKKPNMTLKRITNLALNNKDNIWVTAQGNVYKWERNTWGLKGEKMYFAKLSIGSDNKAYAVRKTLDQKDKAKILQFDGKNWKQIHTFREPINDLAALNADDMWVTKLNNRLDNSAFHWNGKQWEQKGTEMISNLQVGRDGTVMGLRMEEQNGVLPRMFLVRWDGSKWQKVYTFNKGEVISHLAVVDKDTIWVVKGDRPAAMDLYLWNPKSKKWINKGNFKGFDLAAGRDGTLLMTGTRGTIYQWVEKPRMVKKLPQIATKPLPTKTRSVL